MTTGLGYGPEDRREPITMAMAMAVTMAMAMAMAMTMAMAMKGVVRV